MKKLFLTFSVLALMLFMVGNVYSQALPIYNKAYVVFEHYGVVSTTTADTSRWLNISALGSNPRHGGYDVSWFFRSNDSLRVNLKYQLRNTDANYTGSFVAIDSALTISDVSAATDTTTIGITGTNNLTPGVLKGANQVRFRFVYNENQTGTSGSTTTALPTRFRFYIYIKPMHFGM